ncbi:hypothetical protein SLEP1_g40893 [Rubroshorea leprosula]|uniref:Uncharacterized protein n=1 Tax=Rubroshorea leprosula TaxID=152421 RepID=A0AAV5L590_9ROSI|nr:hypothetical protein SLEP1_g40893 [Rubroshorea leprosula]
MILQSSWPTQLSYGEEASRRFESKMEQHIGTLFIASHPQPPPLRPAFGSQSAKDPLAKLELDHSYERIGTRRAYCLTLSYASLTLVTKPSQQPLYSKNIKVFPSQYRSNHIPKTIPTTTTLIPLQKMLALLSHPLLPKGKTDSP